MALLQQTKKGECEVCTRPESTETDLWLMHGNCWMCKECRAEDMALTTQNAKTVIDTSRKIDTQIILRADIYNTTTTSFEELNKAILANDEILPADKTTALMTEVSSRIAVLDAAIFQQKAELVAKENERHSLLTNAQHVHARLREAEKVKFRQFDVNYQPKVVKPTKAGKTTPAPTSKMADIKAAAAKYNNVAITAARVKSVMLTTNKSPEEAAKHLAEILGLL